METILYIAKIISFVLAFVVWFTAACSESIGQAVILTIIGVVLFILAFLFEQIDQADWELKTKYCIKNRRPRSAKRKAAQKNYLPTLF